MKIKYKKKRLNVNLFIGITWAILGTLALFVNEKMLWRDYGLIILSILYLGLYFYEYKNQYLTIKDGIISKNSWFAKKN